MYPLGETTALFAERTVRLRPSSSGTAPSPAKLTADGDRSAAALGVRVERASAEGRRDADTARLSTTLSTDGDLSVVRVAMVSADGLCDMDADVDAALGNAGRAPFERTERMSLLERARGTGRPGRGLPGMTARRGGADAAGGGVPADCGGAAGLESGVDGLPLIAVGGRTSAALKLEESGEDVLTAASSHAARSALGCGGSPRWLVVLDAMEGARALAFDATEVRRLGGARALGTPRSGCMLLVALRVGAERVLKLERAGDGCASAMGAGRVSSTSEAGRETLRMAALCGGEVTTLCSTPACTRRISGERSPESEARGLTTVTIGRITGLRSGGGLWRDASAFARGRLDCCEGGFGGAE